MYIEPEPELRPSVDKSISFTKIIPALRSNHKFMEMIEIQCSCIEEHLLLSQVDSFSVDVCGIQGQKGLFAVIKTADVARCKYAMLHYPHSLRFPLCIAKDELKSRKFLRNVSLLL